VQAALVTALLLAAPKIISTADAAQTNKVFVFDGKVRSVDLAARTFTLQAKKRTYIFSVTDQTRIARNVTPQKFADLKADQDAQVDMKIGPGAKVSLRRHGRICFEQERNAVRFALFGPVRANQEPLKQKSQIPKLKLQGNLKFQ
jgi:hypothetical protein